MRAKDQRPGGGLVHVLRRYEPVARLAIAAFLWATVLGPALHLVDHRDDHDHGQRHQRNHVRSHVHGHSERPHRHASPPATPGADPAAHEPGDPGPPAGAPHGDGQALHFGVALLEGAPVVPPAAPEAIGERTPPELTSLVGPRPVMAAHRPRGPPAAAPSFLNLDV